MKRVIFGLIISIIFLTGFSVYGMGKVIPKKTPMQNVGNGAYCWTPDGKIAFYRLIDHWIKMEPDPFPGGGGVYDDYEKDDEAFIVVRDPETKEEKVLFKIPYKGAAGRATYMDWSAKTNKILLSTGTLVIMSPDGKEFKDVLPMDRICGQGKWSPDGEKILYDAGPMSGNGEDGPKPGLYLMNANSSNNHLLVENGVTGSWSPDGKQIVYQTASRQTTSEERKTELYRNIFYTSDIYIINIDGTGKRLLVENGSGPRWMPKEWIFFGYRSGVYAIRPNGTGRRVVPIVTPVTPPYPPRWQIILDRGNVWARYNVEVLEGETDKQINQ